MILSLKRSVLCSFCKQEKEELEHVFVRCIGMQYTSGTGSSKISIFRPALDNKFVYMNNYMRVWPLWGYDQALFLSYNFRKSSIMGSQIKNEQDIS